MLGRAPAHGKAGSGARACTWAAPRQVHARAWPGQRGEQAALQRAGEERGKEGRRRKEKKENGKRKGKKEKERQREKEKGIESERTPAGFAVGDRAWVTGSRAAQRGTAEISDLGLGLIGLNDEKLFLARVLIW